MVPDVSRGSRTIGLIHYLYRTSDIEAHVDPHLVAAYDHHLPDPGRDAHATFSDLAADLDLWVDALGDNAPKKHVWHCPVRTAPGDRILSDEEWATVARRVLNATGISPDGDDQACRWIAVRHAPDHRLAAEGVRIKRRTGPSGDALGYKVAMVGDRNETQEPIWFAGSTLAPDLSLPRIRKRFTTPTDTAAQPTALDPSGASAPARARYVAVHAADSAFASLSAADDNTAAAQLIGVGEVLDALAQTSPRSSRAELQAAARHFERASRSHIRAKNEEMYALRRAAGQIVHSGTALGRAQDGAATALILDVVILAVIAASRWHSARGHAQQAEAAQLAARHLRTAYQATTAGPLATLRAHGEHLPAPNRRRHTATVHAALRHLADRLQAEPGWDALTAVLDQAEHAGHDTAALLAKAAAQRELDSADSASDVLVWRLHHLGYVTTPPHRPKPNPAPAPAAAAIPQQEAARARRR